MKKQTFILVLVLLLSSIQLYGQTEDAVSKPIKTGNEWEMPGDAIKRSKNFADFLKDKLQLDDSTHQKIFKAFLENTKSVDEIKLSNFSKKEKDNMLKDNRATFNLKLKDILTAGDFKKYIKMKNVENF